MGTKTVLDVVVSIVIVAEVAVYMSIIAVGMIVGVSVAVVVI